MILQIELNGNEVRLILKKGRKNIDEIKLKDEYNLSLSLLKSIDKILKKNRIYKKDIEKVQTKISETSGVTSKRIVQTIAKAWKISKSLQ